MAQRWNSDEKQFPILSQRWFAQKAVDKKY